MQSREDVAVHSGTVDWRWSKYCVTKRMRFQEGNWKKKASKIISFSLWGSNPKYTVGAVRNAEIALEVFPDWLCRFYVSKSVPTSVVEELRALQNTEVVVMEEDGNFLSTFWRFLPASEENVILLSRDTDSRLNLREKDAVDAWLASDKDFHIMRDHPFHTVKIMAGMWGCRNGILKKMPELIQNFVKENYYQVDQDFLRDAVYPLISDSVIVHDAFIEDRPFPTERVGRAFVGEAFNQHDEPRDSDRALIQNPLNN